jgi:hypothetical protein
MDDTLQCDLLQKRDTSSQNTSCIYSSFVFILNTLIAFHYAYHLYAALFFALFCTSVAHHSAYNTYTLLIDKTAILAIFIYGAYIFHQKFTLIQQHIQYIPATIVILSFITTIYLYYYGYIHNKYCYYPHKHTANIYHSILHFIAAIGHIAIIIL